LEGGGALALNGYEKTYEIVRRRLAGFNLAEAAANLGLDAPDGDGRLFLTFLGRRWRVGSGGVSLVSGPDAHVNCKSVIIYYLTSGGSGQPSYKFQLLHTFTSGLFSGQNSAWLSEQGRTDIATRARFRQAAERIGAWVTREERGMCSLMMFAFPKLPVTLTYIEPDEEYEARSLIKFDSSSLSFIPFETLAVLNALIASELTSRRRAN
jgi:hypothetical protein